MLQVFLKRSLYIARSFELRRAWSWAWFLPILLVVGALLITRATYTAPPRLPGYPINDSGPDYADNVRHTLELFLPVVALFMSNQLLADEWRLGTLTQLALRRTILWVVCERFLYVCVYLIVVSFVAALVSKSITMHQQQETGWADWVGQVLLTAIPPAILLSTIALFFTHLTVNASVGYIVAISYWVANLLLGPLLLAEKQTQWLLYNLNSWTFSLSADDVDWQKGKALLLAIGVIVLLIQGVMLRQEARFVHNMQD